MKDKKDLYHYFSTIVSDTAGVQFGDKQKRLVETRLQKRWRELGLETLEEYYQYFQKNPTTEKGQLISLLTTHHTYFFREFAHFEFLLEELPQLVAKLRAKKRTTLRVWSAAASHGEEAYSLAMFLSYHLHEIAPEIKLSILGSDICEASVKKAQKGIYTWEELKKAPRNYITGKWMRGTGDIENYVCAKKELKEMCEFKVMNLFEINQESFREKFDLIFCRNVFIYFTTEQIRLLVKNLMPHLEEHGHFIVGLSESLMHLDIPIGHRGKSIYHLPQGEKKQAEMALSTLAPSLAQTPQRIKTVVCVDDSDVVLKLLERMFNAESGYQVVGVARNGEEAAQVISRLQPDFVTLDIHMPVLDGVSYLEKYYTASHPPVLIVSSVSREERDLALKALRLGAKDYVEKPSLATFTKAQEEIFAKLGAIPLTKAAAAPLDLEQSFARSVSTRVHSGTLAIVAPSDSREAESLKSALGLKGARAKFFAQPGPFSEREFFKLLSDYYRSSNSPHTLFILGKIPSHYYSYLRELSTLHTLFVEDPDILDENVRSTFSFKIEVCPVTSMVYEYAKIAA